MLCLLYATLTTKVWWVLSDTRSARWRCSTAPRTQKRDACCLLFSTRKFVFRHEVTISFSFCFNTIHLILFTFTFPLLFHPLANSLSHIFLFPLFFSTPRSAIDENIVYRCIRDTHKSKMTYDFIYEHYCRFH